METPASTGFKSFDAYATVADPRVELAQRLAGEVQARISSRDPVLVFNRMLTEVFDKRLGVDSWQPSDRAAFEKCYKEVITNLKLLNGVCKFVANSIDATTITERQVAALVTAIAGFVALYKTVAGYFEK